MSVDILPLVIHREGRYVLDGDAVAWLAEQPAPFSVVSCAGKFRTGKSFLMNRLMEAPAGRGFGVGETVQACTRGLWISKRNVGTAVHPIYLLDTEGIDALDVESEHDVCVFALAVLLSSALLYNAQSHLDEAAVQTLSLMTKVAESVDRSHEVDLHWVLRDFSLKLTDATGRPISNDEYLETSLTSGPTGKCPTRSAIRQVFKHRTLVTLPRPQRGESAQSLDTKGPSAVSAKFEKAVAALRASLLNSAKPFAANGVAVSGRLYAEYVQMLLTKINEGGVVPHLSDSWTLLSRTQVLDVERGLLRDVLHEASTKCPSGKGDEVRAWIARAVDERPCHFICHPGEEVVATMKRGVVESVFVACAHKVRTPIDALRDEILVMEGRGFDASICPYESDSINAVIWEAFCANGARACANERALVEKECREKLSWMQVEKDSLLGQLSDVQHRLENQKRVPCVVRVDACVGPDNEGVEPVETAPGDREAAAQDTAALAILSIERDTLTSRVEDLDTELRLLRDREAELTETFKATVEKQAREHDVQKQSAANAFKESQAHANQLERRCDTLKHSLDTSQEALGALQEKTLDMHRVALEAARQSENEHRAACEVHHQALSSATAQAATTDAELRGLKRRLEEIGDTPAQLRRAHAATRALEIERVRDETVTSQLRSQLELLRDENAKMRRLNVELESRLAVSRAQRMV